MSLKDVADHLLAAKGDEWFYRSAISRYYYSLFWLARQSTGVSDQSPSAHEEVVVALRKKSDLAASYLQKLRRLRNQADYSDGLTCDWATHARLCQLMHAEMAARIKGLP
jgi:uncharacterized protein (UPF0332 family)